MSENNDNEEGQVKKDFDFAVDIGKMCQNGVPEGVSIDDVVKALVLLTDIVTEKSWFFGPRG